MNPNMLKCYLCRETQLRPYFQDYHQMQGKNICLTCVQALSSGEHLIKARKLSWEDCGIPENPRLNLLSGKCPLHEADAVFYCEECLIGCCPNCLADHRNHDFENLERALAVKLEELRKLELLALYAETQEPIFADNHKEILQAYTKIQTMTMIETCVLLSDALPKQYRRLQTSFHSYKGLPIPQALERIAPELGTPVRPAPVLHWLEWKKATIHYYNPATGLKSSTRTPGYKACFFSRSLWLSTGVLFVCGGRLNKEGLSVSTCFYLFPENNYEVARLPDMLYGHSNHSILEMNGFIYVGAGCDHHNVFSRKFERFSISSETWEALALMNEVRDSVSCVGNPRESCIYAIAGRIANDSISDSIERYEIATNTWHMLNLHLPYRVYLSYSVLLPGDATQIVTFGGLSEDNVETNRAALIDLSANTTREINSMQGVGGCIVNQHLLYGEHIYTLVFSSQFSRDLERLSLANLTWEALD